MSEKLVFVQTTAERGRYVIQAGGNVFVADSPSGRGDLPTVAPEPVHHLLSALGACALGSAEKQAAVLGVTPGPIYARASGIKDEADVTRFSSIVIDVEIHGVNQSVAEELIAHFINNCPVYNTVRRGGPIDVKVTARVDTLGHVLSSVRV